MGKKGILETAEERMASEELGMIARISNFEKFLYSREQRNGVGEGTWGSKEVVL